MASLSARTLLTLLLRAAVIALFLTAASSTTAWADDGSFTNCPRLSENHSTGPCVVRLQNALNTVNSAYRLDADGVFGRDTRIAVLDFQGRNGLDPSGVVGKPTATALQRQALAKGSVPSPRPGRQADPQPPASQSCQDGDRALARRLAAAGDFQQPPPKVEWTQAPIVGPSAFPRVFSVELRYNQARHCAWALAFGSDGTSVWIERSTDGNWTGSRQLGTTTRKLTSTTVYTGVFSSGGGTLRACAKDDQATVHCTDAL